MNIELTRLSNVRLADLIALHNDPKVLRHLPLAGDTFGEAACRQWVENKERQWKEHGYGPWGIRIDGVFAGWGGLQSEQGDADLALVLLPRFWGSGRIIYRRFITMAFEEMGFESITALLPPGRVRASGMLRLGFQPDGQVWIAQTPFCRYRLWGAQPTPMTDATTA